MIDRKCIVCGGPVIGDYQRCDPCFYGPRPVAVDPASTLVEARNGLGLTPKQCAEIVADCKVMFAQAEREAKEMGRRYDEAARARRQAQAKSLDSMGELGRAIDALPNLNAREPLRFFWPEIIVTAVSSTNDTTKRGGQWVGTSQTEGHLTLRTTTREPRPPSSSTTGDAGASECFVPREENLARIKAGGERKNSAAHCVFMRGWHSMRLSCNHVGSLDMHALRLAEYADDLDTKLVRRDAQMVEIHDEVCRPKQPPDHDFFGCALDGILDWKSALDERKADIDRLATALRLCLVELQKREREDMGCVFRCRDCEAQYGQPHAADCRWFVATDAAERALEEADQPLFVMQTVDVPSAGESE